MKIYKSIHIVRRKSANKLFFISSVFSAKKFTIVLSEIPSFFFFFFFFAYQKKKKIFFSIPTTKFFFFFFCFSIIKKYFCFSTINKIFFVSLPSKKIYRSFCQPYSASCLPRSLQEVHLMPFYQFFV